MAGEIRRGRFLWPGVISPVAGVYCMSQGISPGVAVLKILPQNVPFAMYGDLIITDDVTTLRIPRCKVDKVRREMEGESYVDVISIFDWRWRWVGLGSISGTYNQLDPHAKLIPYTIQSPEELAKLCFAEMGVTEYEIDMPPGLTNVMGQDFYNANPPWIGVIPVTGTNQPVDWVSQVPAVALDRLCQNYGRRIVPRLSDYTMLIVKPGEGEALPPGSIAKLTPTLDPPEAPQGVGVVGDPTRFQMRFLMEAVGRDWDESWRPINDLSYAPQVIVWTPSIYTTTVGATLIAGGTFVVTVTATSLGVTYTFTATYTAGGGDTASDVAIALATQLGTLGAADFANISVVGGVLTFTSLNVGNSPPNISVTSSLTGSSGSITTIQNQSGALTPHGDWSNSGPPTFAIARAVPGRLTKRQAMDLAQKNIFKHYRIVNGDVGSYDAVSQRCTESIKVPGRDDIEIVRRQQILLMDHQVEQIVPEPGDPFLMERGSAEIIPIIINFYNGYSHDKPAAVYGAISGGLQTNWHYLTTNNGNTPEGSQIFLPFTVNSKEQLISFTSHVYAHNGAPSGGRIKEPNALILQTAVQIRDEETNALIRYTNYKTIGSDSQQEIPAMNMIVKHIPEIQLNVIGQYDANSKLTGATLLDGDADMRATYYLEGMEAQYFNNVSEIREYNGFEAINLDGAIQQITWEFGDSGCSTVASRNTEHNVYVPPLAARRRAEFLAPVADGIPMGRIGSRIASPGVAFPDGGVQG